MASTLSSTWDKEYERAESKRLLAGFWRYVLPGAKSPQTSQLIKRALEGYERETGAVWNGSEYTIPEE